MITATDLEVRAGQRILLSINGTSLRVKSGDKIGLVGRNGAGKTTAMRVLACDKEPYLGTVKQLGKVGYLPQDTRRDNLNLLAKDRVLSARGIDKLLTDITKQQLLMSSVSSKLDRDKIINHYIQLEEQFSIIGGYTAEAEANRICSSLGLDSRILAQPLRVLSGGQRRRIELARILFAASDKVTSTTTTLLLDEPTNHLDLDAVKWLQEFLQKYNGGFIVISHNINLLAKVINRVWVLNSINSSMECYNMNWKSYLIAKYANEKRKQQIYASGTKKANALRKQALKIGAKATKSSAAKNMLRRADHIISKFNESHITKKSINIKFPLPDSCGKVLLVAKNLIKTYSSLEVLTGIDFTIDRGSRTVILGLNGTGKTTLLKLLAGVEIPDAGSISYGHGCKIGYFAQEHETFDNNTSLWNGISQNAMKISDQDLKNLLGAFMFNDAQFNQPISTLSGGEKARLALVNLVTSSANLLLLDEPTNNLDPISREQVLKALKTYKGAVVLVTHDPGAAEALNPQRVLLLPESTEDFWSTDYKDLIELC